MPKKIILGGVAVLLALSVFAPVQAQGQTTPVDNSAIIQQLLAQIAALQAQLMALQGGQTTPVCPIFSQNLQFGSTGSAVSVLQNFLMKEGFEVDPAEYKSEGGPAFGESTAAAVVAFQQKYAVRPASGYFGPLTRAKANSLCGKPVPPAQPIFVSSVNPSSAAIGMEVSITGRGFDWKSNSVRLIGPSAGTGYINGLASDPVYYAVPQAQGAGTAAIVASPEGMSRTIRFRVPASLEGCAKFQVVYPESGGACAHFELQPGNYKLAVLNGNGESNNVPFMVAGRTGASVKVISPNGGETWIRGTTQTITWRDNVAPVCSGDACTAVIQKYDIQLVPDYPSYPPCTSDACTVHVYRPPYTLDIGVVGSSYTWFVGKNDYANQVIPDGAYTVQVCGSSCDASDSSFKITSGSSAGAPAISGVSGPTVLESGRQGTWTVTASDPQGGNLYYKVIWGDEYSSSGGTGTSASPAGPAYQQSATFTHTYARAGSYNPIFIVANAQQSSQVTISVNVNGSIGTSPVLTIGSPNGGESYSSGARVAITFRTNLTDKQTSGIILQLYRQDAASRVYVSDIVRNWAGGSPYIWSVPSGLDSGKYYIYAAAENLRDVPMKEVIDFSDEAFVINRLPVAVCDYAAPPQGCTYVPGPNYDKTSMCGMVLSCQSGSTSANQISANTLDSIGTLLQQLLSMFK